MKIDTTPITELKLDGTTKVTITFELGDILTDKSNNYIYISSIDKNEVIFITVNKDRVIEKIPLSKKFLKTHKYAGTIKDDKLPNYKNALPLQ